MQLNLNALRSLATQNQTSFSLGAFTALWRLLHDVQKVHRFGMQAILFPEREEPSCRSHTYTNGDRSLPPSIKPTPLATFAPPLDNRVELFNLGNQLFD